MYTLLTSSTYSIMMLWLACSTKVQQIVGSSPYQVKPKNVILVFVASMLRTQHEGERAKTGWLEIGIM